MYAFFSIKDGDILNDIELERWIKKLIEENKLYKFYKSKYWKGDKDTKGLKNEVLEEQRNECQICLCKSPKVVTKANTVHHVQFVRKHPSLALSRYYTYNGKQYRNLIAVCKECHNKLHPEKNKSNVVAKFVNEERW